MTVPVVVMIIIGFVLIFASYFVSESLAKKEENFNADLLTVKEDYEFSDRELHIIKRKIEDVIAEQAKEILYETNESLANMANEKTLALGDYAVTVCDEIERNHKEVMFLYSMLDDKQKEIVKTVQLVDKTNQELKNSVMQVQIEQEKKVTAVPISDPVKLQKQSAIDQLTALKHMKEKALADTDNQSEIENTSVGKAQTEIKKADSKTVSHKKEQSLDVVKEETKVLENTEIEVSKAEAKDKAVKQTDFPTEQQESVADNNTLDEDLSDYDDVFSEIDQTELDDILDNEFKNSNNSNDIILQMHRNGDSIISIARELGLGVGEVKLVIDLYQGA